MADFNFVRDPFLKILGTVVLLQGGAACADYGVQESREGQGLTSRYKYDTIIRDSSGRYRGNSDLNLGDTRVYFYSFRGTALAKISPDQKMAIREMIESRGGGPIDCLLGFKIIDIGRSQYGGVTAKLECND